MLGHMSVVLSGRWFLHVAFLLVAAMPLSSAYKYFDEPRGRDLQHYDARYFRGRVSAEQRTQTLSELIVAFLDIMETEGIVTWLAHGTLLGWYWNGHTLPWDWDLDMQVDVTSLQTLAEEYNSTVWTAVPANAGPEAEPRDYFLDVNPYWQERVHGDGANFIDARFIDTRNGLYVDITGLTELDPVNMPNIVSCKNYHNYRLEDIYPLRETLFEGTKAKIPYNYKTILTEEYGQRSLILAQYNGYVWAKDRREWLPKDEYDGYVRMGGVPATPPTRIIPDSELPYSDNAPVADSLSPDDTSSESKTAPLPTNLLPVPSPLSTDSIMLEELPADRIDTASFGSKGNIFRTFWEYLTLYWRT